MGRACIQVPTADGRFSLFYDPTPKQDQFHLAPEPNVLYGGAAGGGKSHAIRMDAYMRCMACPGYRALLLRRTWRELETTHIERALIEVAQLGGQYFKSEYRARWPNGSALEFGHAEDDSTVAKYLSTEYDAIYFDELVSFTEYQFKFIASRARSTKPGVIPCIRCASNPGGSGSHWVRRYFIFRDISLADDPSYKPELYQFIPATLDDNPYIDATYESRLMSLPNEALRRAYRFGDWDVFEGQFFSEWRATSEAGQPWHVIPELPKLGEKSIAQSPHIEHFRAIDWGYREPGVCGWYACLPDGRLVKTQEYVFRETTPKEVAKEIKRRSKGMKIRYTVADPSIFSNDIGESIAETFARNGVSCNKADNSRINGWARMHEWLLATTAVGGERMVPMLQVYGPGCPYTCRTIPTLVVDEHRLEDLRTKGTEDHAADETRYALMSRPSPSREPKRPRYIPGTVGHDLQAILDTARQKRQRLGVESVRTR